MSQKQELLIKIANIDLQCKEHNFKSVNDFFEKRWKSPGIQSIVILNKEDNFHIELFQLTRDKGRTFIKDDAKINLFKAQPFFFPNKKKYNYKMYSKELEKSLLTYKPDIVHINQSSGKNLYRFCKFLVKNNFKYLIHFRGGDLEHYDEKRSFVFKNASKIIVNNKLQKGKILKIFKEFENKTEIIPLGIDLSYFKVVKSEREPFSFGYTGRIYEHKGLLEALDFIHFIKKFKNDVKYYIAGNFETEKFKREFYSKIESLDLKENIIFEGYLTGKELVQFYNKFTYLLFLSRHESFGKSVVEAMACGVIPLIKRDSSGPEEIINNGEFGYILPDEGNWNFFIKELNRKEKTLDLQNRVIKRAKNYALDSYINRLKNLYLNL